MCFCERKILLDPNFIDSSQGQVKKVCFFFLKGSLHIKVCDSLLLPPPISANRAGFVTTDKFKAPLFLYFSVLQSWRFKMTGPSTKSAFAEAVIILIFMLKYTRYEILLGA